MNLLPEAYKKALRYEAWRRYTLAVGVYVAIILVIANVLLLPSFFFVVFQVDAAKDHLNTIRLSPEFKEVADSEVRIKRISKYLRVVTALEHENKPITPVLEDIIKRPSASTTISTLTFTRTKDGTSAINIFGEASYRDNLATFENELKQSPYIKGEPHSPITNYLTEKNIKYNLTLDLIP